MNRLHIIFFIFGTLFFFSSCEEKEVVDADASEVAFDIKFASRSDDDSRLEDINDYFVEGESCILISQRTDYMSYNFKEGSSNCYKYIYYRNDEANWESGYNFKSQNPMSWDKIKLNDTFGSTYAFGALFFPRYYKYLEEVNADQSDYDSFMECDVLGAWHRTSEELSRLQFEFNHLMCKLHINLYVPVFDAETNTGYDLDGITATALSFRRDYEIKMGERSTEQPPYALPWGPESPDKIRLGDIKMYQFDNPEECVITNLHDFGVFSLEEDKVRKYSFEVIFPQQSLSGDIIRFVLSRDDINYNFLFNTDYFTKDKVNFLITAGTITQLELYLSRTGNEIVMFNAYLNDWNDASASFTVTEEKDNAD